MSNDPMSGAERAGTATVCVLFAAVMVITAIGFISHGIKTLSAE